MDGWDGRLSRSIRLLRAPNGANKKILENTHIDEILNRLEFGISNRAMIHLQIPIVHDFFVLGEYSHKL